MAGRCVDAVGTTLMISTLISGLSHSQLHAGRCSPAQHLYCTTSEKNGLGVVVVAVVVVVVVVVVVGCYLGLLFPGGETVKDLE